jgi:hypothetical protein
MNRDGFDDDDSRALYPGVMSGVGPYMYYIIMFSVCCWWCCSPVRLTAGFGQVNFFLVFLLLFQFFFGWGERKTQNNSNKS